MRVNIYAEELPEPGEVRIIAKNIEEQAFTGLRIPCYLPVTLPDGSQVRGKFMHHPDDDDSAAITIWGKRDLRVLLREAMVVLDQHYGNCSALESLSDLEASCVMDCLKDCQDSALEDDPDVGIFRNDAIADAIGELMSYFEEVTGVPQP